MMSAAIDPGIFASRLRTSSRPGAGWLSFSSPLTLSMYSTAKLDRPGAVVLTTLTSTCSCSFGVNPSAETREKGHSHFPFGVFADFASQQVNVILIQYSGPKTHRVRKFLPAHVRRAG